MKVICIGRRIGLEDYLDCKMEKLVELLNEFEIGKPARDYTWRIEKQNETRICWTEYTWAYVDDEEAERIIISKKYKFIEWLVKEDKIDFYKVSQAENELEVDVNVYKLSYEDDNYYWLLMILAIQDEPIKFLISVLK